MPCIYILTSKGDDIPSGVESTQEYIHDGSSSPRRREKVSGQKKSVGGSSLKPLERENGTLKRDSLKRKIDAPSAVKRERRAKEARGMVDRVETEESIGRPSEGDPPRSAHTNNHVGSGSIRMRYQK